MDKNEFQKLLAFAIKNEIEAQKFYRQVSEKVKDPYLKILFGQFVEEEKKHQQLLEEFQTSDASGFHFQMVPDYHVSETEPNPKVSADMKPADAFALAMKKEEKAVKLYLSFADAASDPSKKKIFNELAAMEREHKHKMESAFVDVGYPEVW